MQAAEVRDTEAQVQAEVVQEVRAEQGLVRAQEIQEGRPEQDLVQAQEYQAVLHRVLIGMERRHLLLHHCLDQGRTDFIHTKADTIIRRQTIMRPAESPIHSSYLLLLYVSSVLLWLS